MQQCQKSKHPVYCGIIKPLLLSVLIASMSEIKTSRMLSQNEPISISFPHEAMSEIKTSSLLWKNKTNLNIHPKHSNDRNQNILFIVKKEPILISVPHAVMSKIKTSNLL